MCGSRLCDQGRRYCADHLAYKSLGSKVELSRSESRSERDDAALVFSLGVFF